jgi:centrin-1
VSCLTTLEEGPKALTHGWPISMLSSTDKKDTKEDIMHVFNLFDHDASGKITLEDLRRVADELGEQITDEELRNMIARADTNEDNAISKDEFLAIMLRSME